MPFVLTIGERGSSWAGRPNRTSLHDTREQAEAELLQYVRLNWDDEMDGDEPPEDPEEMIEQYFEYVPERYDILDVNVPSTLPGPSTN